MRRRWLRVLCLAIGVALLGYTVSGLFRNRVFLFDSVAADGVVQDVRPARDGATSLVVRFTSEQGAVVDWVSRTQQPTTAYQVGEHVPVLYMPNSPGRAAIGRFRDIFGIFMLTGGVGLILVLIGLRTMRSMWRRFSYER